MWSVKMLKLLYIHNGSRPTLFQSLALGYTHILTRTLTSSSPRPSTRPTLPVFQKSSVVTSQSMGSSGALNVLQREPEPFLFNYDVSKNNREVIRSPRESFRPTPLHEVSRQAEAWLGSDNFSAKSCISYNFGRFSDIITLFSFKMAHVDHPLLYLTK